MNIGIILNMCIFKWFIKKKKKSVRLKVYRLIFRWKLFCNSWDTFTVEELFWIILLLFQNRCFISSVVISLIYLCNMNSLHTFKEDLKQVLTNEWWCSQCIYHQIVYKYGIFSKACISTFSVSTYSMLHSVVVTLFVLQFFLPQQKGDKDQNSDINLGMKLKSLNLF